VLFAFGLVFIEKGRDMSIFSKKKKYSAAAQAVHSTTTICALSHVVGLDGSGELAR
jgi:hypothetical protein